MGRAFGSCFAVAERGNGDGETLRSYEGRGWYHGMREMDGGMDGWIKPNKQSSRGRGDSRCNEKQLSR